MALEPQGIDEGRIPDRRTGSRALAGPHDQPALRVPDRRRGSRVPDAWVEVEPGRTWDAEAGPAFEIPVDAIRQRLDEILDFAEARLHPQA